MGTVSTRLLWPFMRVTAGAPADPAHLQRLGLDVSVLADPDGRMPHELARKLLAASIERTGNPALGLLAGEMVESIDTGVLHYAVRNCRDLRSALASATRYLRIVDSLLDGRLSESDDRAIWTLRYDLPNVLPQTSDFQMTFALRSIRAFIGEKSPPIEVRFTHARATDADHYARFFRCPIVFNAAHNALVFPRTWLDRPLVGANPDLLPEFERQAQRFLDDLAHSETTSARVRKLLLQQMGDRNATIEHMARQLHMSASTLRRRLREEGTTHSELLDNARRDLALRQLVDSRISIGELSLLLGFSNPAAFSRAFKRWTGTSPLDYRHRT